MIVLRKVAALALATVASALCLSCDGATSKGEPPSSQPIADRATEPPSTAGSPTSESETPPPPWSDEWLLGEATRYVDDPTFRREMVVRSLTNPNNQYSTARISAYGHESRGWDVLPVWVPTAAPVDAAVADSFARGEPLTLPPRATPLWDGTRPTTMEQWVTLGRRVFFEYPLRPEVFAEHALAHPQVAEDTGLMQAPDGTYPGLVAFADIDQRVRVGITCALCHTAVDDHTLVVGQARRTLDYGQLRLAYHRDTGAPIPARLAERMATWGPGRADITEDDDEDPVAIVDLWGVRDQTALTQAGTIDHLHPAALAIRQETQILHANRERSRPPRELAWALAMYVYSLEPPPRSQTEIATADASTTKRGASLFGAHCRGCHENASHGGRPLAAERVGTEPTLARGRARGTGLYRPSPLVRVADAAPYLHNGSLPSLDALLSTERLSADYRGGTRGPGPIVGHTFGTELPDADKHALVAYLRTL